MQEKAQGYLPSGLMARWGLFIWKRECMQITVMPQGGGAGVIWHDTSPKWCDLYGVELQASFHLTLPFGEVTSCSVTWLSLTATPGCLIMSLRGLNETNIKLEKVRFRAFKVFLVLTNVGYYGVKHRNRSIRRKTKYLKHTEVILHEGHCICHCFEGLCDS